MVDERWIPHESPSSPSADQLTIPPPEEKVLTTELDDILDAFQMEDLERQNIIKALNRCDWRISGKNGAAMLLGIPPTTLSSQMKALKIKRPN